MPTTEPTPPTADPPDEIEAAIDSLIKQSVGLGRMPDGPERKMQRMALNDYKADVRRAIRAALAERQQKSLDMVRATTDVLEAINERTDDRRSEIVALRERCERLEARLAECESGIIEP